jgi:hypothetical protein
MNLVAPRTDFESVEVTGSLLVRPIDPAERLGWQAYMARFHYLGKSHLVGESLRYAAFVGETLVALLGWSAASLHNRLRNEYVGWDEHQRRAHLQDVVSNARFLILPWIHQPNLASRILGANLRRLPSDWQRVYGHRVVLAETYVDTTRFLGTCYRASNWVCVGQTRGYSKSGYTYQFHGKAKSVWLYPLEKNFRAQLCKQPQRQPEVKETKTMAIALDVDQLPLAGAGGLFDVLATIVDPRKKRGIRHKMQGLLAICICGALTGCKSFAALGEWAVAQSRETLLRFGSKRGKAPNEITLRRALQRVDVAEVDRKIGDWVVEQLRLGKGALALDGKVVRGSSDGERPAVNLLSAVVHKTGVIVSQVRVDSKTNEIPCVKPLLENLHIEGCVVTADALHTQTETARFLVEEKKADYLFIVKENQPTLRSDIATCLELGASPP